MLARNPQESLICHIELDTWHFKQPSSHQIYFKVPRNTTNLFVVSLLFSHVLLLNYCAVCGDRVKIFIGNYSVLVCAVLKISADSKVYISVSVIRKKQSF